MKRLTTLPLILAMFACGLAFAQAPASKETGSKNELSMQKCMDLKGMNMKEVDPQKCKGSEHPSTDTKPTTHQAAAIVKQVNPADGKVTLAHDAVNSLKWPAMTMTFSVKDKPLFDKLGVGKKVNVEFVQQGSNYIVTAVK